MCETVFGAAAYRTYKYIDSKRLLVFRRRRTHEMAAARRRPPRCSESPSAAIDSFEQSMGLSIRGFTKTCVCAKKEATLKLDDKHTAFGKPFAMPVDFVPPLKPTKPPDDNDNQEPVAAPRKKKVARPQSASTTRKYDTTKPKIPPVDFVYDIATRKQLRAAIELERKELRHLVQERETDLRQANLWLNDKRPSPPKAKARKERVCWSTPRRAMPPPSSSSASRESTPRVDVAMTVVPLDNTSQLHRALDEIVWPREQMPPSMEKKKQRPMSAINRRNSIAENVHFVEWQTSNYHTQDNNGSAAPNGRGRI
ncbi:Aste57867_39 [Aphanomyces stellatus]|uniref:Aste57867_39 protein n=1 Tax=Aphanomyces stellatus TaxID=120398 RepID=A0A485K213_9STRA|nr:hypothetical protein As57867_000039 [Aphanomyces stellatus]VFT77265.1 Aste57867_39 [Aphanomyces stellatus]